MNKKPFYESKTMIFNVCTLALVIIQAITEQHMFNIPPETQAILISTINLILRLASDNKNLTLKK
jgi:hypothetical protein